MCKVVSFSILAVLFFFDFQAWSFEGLSTETINAYQYPKGIQWIDLDDIKMLFKNKPPISVGFDVDDTLLFSGAIVEKNIPSFDELKFLANYDLIFKKMNCDEVKFSIPKRIGKQLIAFHQVRGDEIYFITARAFTPCVNEGYSINDWIKETFNIQNLHPVIFTDSDFGRGSKAKWLKDLKLAVYYGDSDTDIEAAQKAGVLGVRVMRASNSWEKVSNHIGKYGELVIRRSDI
jgi:acid phosphatase (class B)